MEGTQSCLGHLIPLSNSQWLHVYKDHGLLATALHITGEMYDRGLNMRLSNICWCEPRESLFPMRAGLLPNPLTDSMIPR